VHLQTQNLGRSNFHITIFCAPTAQIGVRSTYGSDSLDTYTIGRTPLYERSASRRGHYLDNTKQTPS